MGTKNIIILGGGATGWSVASFLKKQLPRELVNIQLVDDARKDMVVVEASHSAIHNFHDLIGLPEKACVIDANTRFGLGLGYKNWSRAGQHYGLAEGMYGAPLDAVDFPQLFAKSLALNLQHNFDDYSLNAVAAKLGRFGHPAPDPKSIYSSIKYGLNLSLNDYAQILKHHALHLGVSVVHADCIAVELNPADGNISSIKLSNGDSLTADIFIDCSGDASVLLGAALGVDSVETDLSHVFDCVAVGSRLLDAGMATILEHGDHGCLKRVPLRDREIITYYFSSERVSHDDIKKEMLELGVVDVSFSSARFNRKEHFWVKNCLAIGGSALSFFETYVSPLHLVRNSIVRFLDLLVDFDKLEASRREYNRLAILEFQRLEELSALQFYVAKDNSKMFADYFDTNNLPANAQHRLDLFSLTGRHAIFETSIISEAEWTAFFMGNGVLPKTYSMIAEGIENDKLVGFTERLKAVIQKAAEHMPSQEDYLAQIAVIK